MIKQEHREYAFKEGKGFMIVSTIDEKQLFKELKEYAGLHKDKTGIIKMVYPAPLMDNETVYTIAYENSNNSGMFKHSELKELQINYKCEECEAMTDVTVTCEECGKEICFDCSHVDEGSTFCTEHYDVK